MKYQNLFLFLKEANLLQIVGVALWVSYRRQKNSTHTQPYCTYLSRVSSADNIYKQFGPRSGPTKLRA